MKLKEKIALIISAAMQDQGITYSKLQELSRVSSQQIQSILRRGKIPRENYTIDTLEKIADALEVKINLTYKNLNSSIYEEKEN